MNDLPGGEWSALLVGHQWPSSVALAALAESAQSRARVAVLQRDYAETLRSIRTNTLANQHGVTADDLNETFETGERAAYNLSGKNRIKQTAYVRAAQHVEDLRSSLTDIAAQGNSEIRAIVTSHQPLPSKVDAIAAAVLAAQTHANAKAAECSAHLLDAMQSLVEIDDPALSARQFTGANGTDLGRAFGTPSPEIVRREVEHVLGGLAPPTDAGPAVAGKPDDSRNDLLSSGEDLSVPGDVAPNPRVDASPDYRDVPAEPVPQHPGQETATNGPADTNSVAVQHDPVSKANPSAIPSPVGSTSSTAPNPKGGQTAVPANAPATEQTVPREASSANTFDAGRPTGSIPPNAEAFNPATSGVLHITPSSIPLNAALGDTTATAAPNALFETSAVAAPAEIAHPTVIDTAQSLLTPAPVAAVSTSIAPGAVNPSAPNPPTAAQGPLLAYGSDLRSAMSTPPVLPPAAPSSAPGNPTGAAGSVGQPALVRQQSATIRTAQSALGSAVTEHAFSSTAAGNRLRRLLEAVARQQPRLRWGIGDLDDTTTLVVTDLADGWIPPHIAIPTGVRLLPPGIRGNSMPALLGEVTQAEVYEPGQRLRADAAPVPMSVRARDTATVDDLGWEITQATRWRDGLPRLAHTLARAACARTGYLDSEVALFREHLDVVTRAILESYPDGIEPNAVGDWQILATVDALINNEKVCAHYHFAWFKALALTREECR